VNPPGSIAASKNYADGASKAEEEAIMRRASINWLPGAVGALIGVAIVAASGGDVPIDSLAAEQWLLGAATLGRAVAEFVGIGFGLGLTLFVAGRLAAFAREHRRLALRDAAREMAVEVVVSLPRVADATASEFDAVQARAPAPITSLTEAQVRRQRADRKRAERRAGLKGA
jgi:hypothetical protein